MKKGTWYNFRTEKYETSDEPEIWSDAIPQDEETLKLYDNLVSEGMSPKEAIGAILAVRVMDMDIAEFLVSANIEHQARNN